MQDNSLQSLLNKTQELEKRYEWLQAAEIYQKASPIALKNNDLLKVAELDELIGFCYFRAAFQAQNNIEFKDRLKLAIQAYDKESRILNEAKVENKQVRIKKAEAWIIYIRSWLETSALKRKELLDEWWTLENRVLEAYESIGDVHSIGNVCTEMIELSLYTQVWLADYSELAKLEKQTLSLIDKAIQSLSQSGDDYELASAYTIASFRLSFDFVSLDSYNKRLLLFQRCQDYLKKALKLSEKIGDARLIGLCYVSAMNIEAGFVWNTTLALEYGKKIQKYGNITQDNFLLGYNAGVSATLLITSSEFMEDPEKQRENLRKARKMAQECKRIYQIINHGIGFYNGLSDEIQSLTDLAAIETDPKNKQHLLEKAIEINQEGFRFFREWKRLSGFFYASLSSGLSLLSETKSDVEAKKALLLEAQSYQKKRIAHSQEFYPFYYGNHSRGYYELCKVQQDIAKIESEKKEKIVLLKKALACLEKSNKLKAKSPVVYHDDTLFASGVLWKHSDRLGRILQQIHSLTKEEKTLSMAIEAYKTAANAAEKAELPTHMAESLWHVASLLSQRGEYQEASQSYKSASEAFDVAAKKIPKLKDFYNDYSVYMRAWSQIEQARHAHQTEDYIKAQACYEKAANLQRPVEPWRYLSPNYFAWASMEEAESLSRNEQTQKAKQTFQNALEQFSKAEKSIKQKLDETTSSDDKEMILKLLNASDLRRKYCQARILLEDAKLLDREGKYLESSKNYEEAAQKIEEIVKKMTVEAERKELELLATLCQAWEKMANAEETTSSESYLEAASLFERAKEHCYTRKASLWALGNSNFCRGLAAGVKYQTRLDLVEHSNAKGYMKNASTNYLQAGFKNASEYAKATQRLFDAYLHMNQAESEADQEKRAKQYQIAENLLQISAGSFMRAKQPEKTAQVKQMLQTVREEKALAVSLAEVLHAPTITSSTMSFMAPSPTNEASVGLESFEHANVQANLIAGARQVRVGESFCLTIEFVNAGKEPALLTRVEDFVPKDFTVFEKPQIYQLEGSCLNMKGKQLASLKLVEAKLILQPSKKGVYKLEPKVYYLDELGQKKTIQLKALEIEAEEVILADRLSTGTDELNAILLGGIPERYAVALTGAPSIERKMIVNKFLQTGTEEGQVTFYVSSDLFGVRSLLERPSFYFFLCNLKLKDQIPDLPNVYKLHGKTDLNNLGIALVKAYRSIDPNTEAPKRICVNILSDVLVNYGVKATRKWISELITNLISKGFTVLAVFDVGMHPADEANAVLGLFDGEISLFEIVDEVRCRKSLRVRKLGNKDYIENPICLTKQK